MHCIQCGNQINADTQYCPHCGQLVNPEPAAAHPQKSSSAGPPAPNGLTIRTILIGAAVGLVLSALCAPLVLYARNRILHSPLNPDEAPPPQVIALERQVIENPESELPDMQPSTLQPTPQPASNATPTPDTVWVELLEGNAREFSQPPDLIAFANDEEVNPPASVQLAPFCIDSCFRYHEWLGMTMPGESYDVIYSGTTDTLGVQLWGDPGDGIAHIYVDGNLVWEGDTEGTDTNYPGGAFVKYLQINNLPDIPNHILRVETDETGGGVTIYFFGFGPAVP